MKSAYKQITETLAETSQKIIAVEQRYRYLHGQGGQIEGVIDAVIEQKNGQIVLKEWKTSSEITADKEQSYTLQAGAGALGFFALNSLSIDVIEIVPLLAPSKRIELHYNNEFKEQINQKLEGVFRDLQDREYEPREGPHCELCQLKPHCPAWNKR
jgi:CRISPR/Cas system-associated exonuclease Cas4 (RecB family)